MAWKGLATILYFNTLWGFMAYLYTNLDIQEFLFCFLGGIFFSLGIATLVGLYHLDHPPTSRSHTRLNRRLLRVWAPVTLSCSAAIHTVLIWRACSPLLDPNLRQAMYDSTGNVVLVLAVLAISSACVSAIVLATVSLLGHLFIMSLFWANFANAQNWAAAWFEPLEMESMSILRPAWDVWTFTTAGLAFLLGPWLALRAGNAFGLLPSSPNLDHIIHMVNRIPNAPRPPDNTFPPPPASICAPPPRASSSSGQLEHNDVPCLSLQNNVKGKEKERKEGNQGKGNRKGKGRATRD